MTLGLLTKHHLEFLSLKGGCTGPSESTLVKMPHCWKSHVAAHLVVRCLVTIRPVVKSMFKSSFHVYLSQKVSSIHVVLQGLFRKSLM